MIIQLDRTAFKRRIWQRAFHRVMHNYTNKVKNTHNQCKKDKAIEQLLEKYIFYGIKCFGIWDEDTKNVKIVSDETLKMMFEQYSDLMNHIALMTPREFMQCFPITKDYDGDRWETKDYFYTMNSIKEFGIDEPIKETFTFLWDYWNRDTSKFLLNYMSVLSELKRRQTGMGVMEEFLINNGLEPYYREDF